MNTDDQQTATPAPSKIVAFVDASIYADSVCDHAAWVASMLGAHIDLVHVLGRRERSAPRGNLSGALQVNARDSLLEELAASDEAAAKLSQKRGRLILEAAKARLVDKGALEAAITTKLRIGDLVETLHELETAADLIVIGKRGEAADFAKLHLGSNIERVVRASTKPILVSARAFKPITKVLVAYDGGDSINRAVGYLTATGKIFGGVHIELIRAGTAGDPETAALERAGDKLREAGYDVATRAVTGAPEAVIGDAVKTGAFNLLVMGAYGHSRIRTLIIGSTTTEMVRSCLIPILLFR